MCCNNQEKNTCEHKETRSNGCNSFVILIVLYILLAIILGSRLY